MTNAIKDSFSDALKSYPVVAKQDVVDSDRSAGETLKTFKKQSKAREGRKLLKK